MSGTWSSLSTQPSFGPGTMLLLTDGTVLVQQSRTNQWWRLSPDITGNYGNGTWTTFLNSQHAPTYYASAVLRDGRVFVAGGEDDGGSNGVDIDVAVILDPVANTWTPVPTPGWGFIGDAPSCMFPDGRILLGSINDSRCSIFDPVAVSWTAAANKLNASSSEETWTLLPDQTILTCDCTGNPGTQKYVIAANQWVPCPNTPVDLVEAASIEIGPALLLPDGRVFAIGATGATALYSKPAVASQPGSWAQGPTFPQQSGKPTGAKDAPGCLMPNGIVLCVVGPVDGISGDYLGPSYFFEFNPATAVLTQVSAPSNGGGVPFTGRMLLLPSGQVLFGSEQYNQLSLYTPSGGPQTAWQPTITNVSATHLTPNQIYTVSGTQLNGLSQAVSYGDDAQMATNYPLVRLVYPNNQVFYCRTTNPSTMAVATGSTVESTSFTVPGNAPSGAAQLFVVANGIPSAGLAVSVGPAKTVIQKEVKELIKEVKVEHKEVSKVEIKELEHKPIKELENKPIKEVSKPEIENAKTISEFKQKDSETGQFGQQVVVDPAMSAAILAQAIDNLSAQQAIQQALITPAERPAVGEAPLRPAPPKGS